MFAFAFILSPVAVVIIILLKMFSMNRVKKRILNACLILTAIVYLVLCLTLKTEPFNYDTENFGDFILNSLGVLLVSPFLWIVLFYYCWQLFRNRRIRRNAKIKSDKSFIYYRDDLDKISPSIIMFISKMDIDTPAVLSANILKLKLMGYIKEHENKLYVTNKNQADLSESDQLVLKSFSTGSFEEKAYKELIKKEALDKKYIKRNNHGKVIKIIKMLITVVLPIIFTMFSVRFDKYVFENYRIYKEDNGTSYVRINNHELVEKLYENEKIDKDDYYHRTIIFDGEEKEVYYYNYIRADRLKYGIILLARLLNILDILLIAVCVISYFVALFKIINQIVYFNKDYYRTAEGNKLLNKAYALKNYLKDFSLMKDRSEKELVLWDYYLIYAVILDVNIKLKNEMINKYLKNITLK